MSYYSKVINDVKYKKGAPEQAHLFKIDQTPSYIALHLLKKRARKLGLDC